MTYPINVNLIPGLPKTPFRKGIGKPEIIVAHSTCNPSVYDNAISERAWEAKDYNNAFVHAFVDADQILQVASLDYISYNCGPGANSFSIGVEACEMNTQDKFNKMYDKYTWYLAHLLDQFHLPITALYTHNEVRLKFGGTSHSDPDASFSKWGKSIANLKADVKAKLDAMHAPAVPVFTPFIVVIDADVLNVHKTADINAASVVSTVKKGEAFTVVGMVNGMYKLKSGLYISSNSAYSHKK